MTDPKQSTVRDEIVDILGLEISPDGEPYYLLIRDDNDTITGGTDFSIEIDELEAVALRHTAEVLERLQKETDLKYYEYNNADPSFLNAQEDGEQNIATAVNDFIEKELSAIKEQLKGEKL